MRCSIKHNQGRKGWNRFMKEFIKDLAIAVIIVAAVSFVIKPTIVKQQSMEPTLNANDYLILNKLSYFHKDHPQYGDIIVFQSDLEKDDGSGKKLLIKRVIGVEGDVISIRDGKVYRNGEELDEPYIHGQETLEEDMEIDEMKIGPDELFCMGDNRQNSKDSRSSDVGNVDEDAVVGKAVVRLYPFNKITRL